MVDRSQADNAHRLSTDLVLLDRIPNATALLGIEFRQSTCHGQYPGHHKLGYGDLESRTGVRHGQVVSGSNRWTEQAVDTGAAAVQPAQLGRAAHDIVYVADRIPPRNRLHIGESVRRGLIVGIGDKTGARSD